MKYYSTNNKNLLVSFSTAVKKGIAEDGGLFMPVYIPKLSQEFFNGISDCSFREIAFNAAEQFVNEDIPGNDLKDIISKSFTFPAPLVEIEKNKYVLELFHGPTLAFKDFGARFMANTLSYLIRNENNEIVILVATSGDTGSAVANGFYNVEGIKVVLLYPSGKVSKIQEQQLTTLDGNITALEIDGTFDDCQRLVKEAFADEHLNNIMNLSSANSINISRLLPQSFYYFHAYAQLKHRAGNNVVFSVPSGNLGNLTGGLLAMEMGLPVYKFIAAVNANDIVPEYLRTGIYNPKPSIRTMSNAMDVGDPSNIARIRALYKDNHDSIRNIIFSKSYTDDDTGRAIQEVEMKSNYLLDPHGAIGYLAAGDLEINKDHSDIIILETAHPAKFADVIEPLIGRKINVPSALADCMNKEKYSIKLSRNFEELKSFLTGRIK